MIVSKFFKLTIVSINVLDKRDKESDEEYVNRMKNISNLINTLIPKWDIIGLQEIRHTRSRKYAWSPDIASAKKIPHPETGEMMFTPDYIASILCKNKSDYYTMSKGRTGIIAKSENLELINNNYVHIGKSKCGEIKPELLYFRLKIKILDLILPFYTVHISRNKNSDRRSMINDLKNTIFNWYENGDLLPVVCGDFNINKINNSPELYKIMEEQYIDLGWEMEAMDKGVDFIWIGRDTIFTMNEVKKRYHPKIIGYNKFYSFYDDGNTLTDHPAISGVIKIGVYFDSLLFSK